MTNDMADGIMKVLELKERVETLEADNRQLRERLEMIETSAKAFTGYNFDKKGMWPAAYNCITNIGKEARDILGDWTAIEWADAETPDE